MFLDEHRLHLTEVKLVSRPDFVSYSATISACPLESASSCVSGNRLSTAVFCWTEVFNDLVGELKKENKKQSRNSSFIADIALSISFCEWKSFVWSLGVFVVACWIPTCTDFCSQNSEVFAGVCITSIYWRNVKQPCTTSVLLLSLILLLAMIIIRMTITFLSIMFTFLHA